MTEAGAIYSALGKHTGAAGFRSPQQTLPNTPVSAASQHNNPAVLTLLQGSPRHCRCETLVPRQMTAAWALSAPTAVQPSLLSCCWDRCCSCQTCCCCCCNNLCLRLSASLLPPQPDMLLSQFLSAFDCAAAAVVTTTQVYEFRQYQLDPGYGSVPQLVSAFADG